MLINEKIKASEVHLTGLNGEDLGIVPTSEALAMAKSLKVDLIALSLMSSPPPCKLMRSGAAKEEAQKEKKKEREPKLKEVRLTPQTEEHDLETKRQQAERILKSGGSVFLVIKAQGKDGTKAKELLQRLIKDLSSSGKPKTGIQLSGKQAAVQLDPA
ncbi:translation initiation factor IF-3 [Cohnella faecalis]|uniref:Translation initiation factor IF-3 n=1 Tax=Cohnella faecalis TaxID=2315694 RepID=A0A398CSR5_9BACL|nr:translation initiation factor IF-3 [Cohnella faecalis]RIE05200.1 translation initiation factor IF-3 [Cohnella faecalis]